ncbi:MAG TPA: tRNA (adenosine(37)-N6)-threonylcarbamoyltransferase complex ATPase subunit type 1 TsaE [Steroidobacteraceae bacterium]|nr:tRNA (adenosine(37)-N6)-threonylcarbamoyltransferase complex ATPase subunit type 1 TsaE [Steroidobacteraceae bacterium]
MSFELRDAAATLELGAALAGSWPQATRACTVVHLHGELGAGKTTCVRGLLQALGAAGPVRSPTYTLVETYPTSRATCVHVDLYRLQGGSDVFELGLRDYLLPGQLLLIEWPERGGSSLPAADLEMALDYADGGRRARLLGRGEIGKRWLEDLASNSRIISYLPNLT